MSFEMYAIVDIQGQQMRVAAGDEVFVNRVAAEEGTKVNFDKVLLVADGENTQIGRPNLKGSSVAATVLSHLKGDKVLVFKKKRRKGYRVKNGHRQLLTKLKIEGIKA
jgi:large subunit ribosomal protein L21